MTLYLSHSLSLTLSRRSWYGFASGMVWDTHLIIPARGSVVLSFLPSPPLPLWPSRRLSHNPRSPHVRHGPLTPTRLPRGSLSLPLNACVNKRQEGGSHPRTAAAGGRRVRAPAPSPSRLACPVRAGPPMPPAAEAPSAPRCRPQCRPPRRRRRRRRRSSPPPRRASMPPPHARYALKHSNATLPSSEWTPLGCAPRSLASQLRSAHRQ
jgi:hypothetical protein